MTISTDFEAIAKRHKRRLTLKYVVLSAGLALVALVLGYMGLNRLTSMNGQYLMAYYNNRIQIAYPNIDVNSFFYNANSQFTGELHSERTKDIAGISVPFEPYRAPYSLPLPRERWTIPMNTLFQVMMDGQPTQEVHIIKCLASSTLRPRSQKATMTSQRRT
ncbi:sigma factor regulator N-terminal domain-containing protein [Streptococcus equi]|uniref:sigma factor regulator N-terminal domain-containing protein n=1 Tax=Streptococcus equi TaxID=1336 RepID=UPI00030C1885|nr:sigma factor regulator N-terminal domain-containing protein [Streptococcus equi]WGS34665.1 sigma factor regulator N-terminal domain-containing protein [Streptococcus equi]WOK46333.1 sigma factor regulator N-terminal domain-containing protein [Streptococcus equi subsp. equi]WOK48192.1 sigma factor regulator N-terminal domain-containing protein [Streptococcus equi subsp. equi]WOK50095.1 sigma factor regulator N-terminal domain-containing protein [Streptococcus equi subsp. equi]WOK50731.1 sigm